MPIHPRPPGPGDDVLKIALESITDAVIVTSADLDDPGPRIEYVNPAFTRMSGYEAHEVVGRTPRMLQGLKTSPDLLATLRQSLGIGQSFAGETSNYRKDGTEYVVSWVITPALDQDGRVKRWIAVQRDVTERKELQTSLLANEQRLQFIVESARDYAIFVTDRQDVITDWWPGAASVYGWTAEQAVGQPSSLIFTAEDQAAGIPEQETGGAMRYGTVPNVRWHLHASGRRIFIEGSVRALRDSAGKLLGFLKIGQDVTERQEADRRLRDSEARLSRALAAARLSTWEWEAANGAFHFSPGMEALYGRPEGGMSSVASTLETIHPDDRPAFDASMERALSGEDGGEMAVEFRVLLPNGDARWLLSTGKVERGADGELTRVAGVTQDITERREAAERITYLARHDGLTGLVNRETLWEQLAIAARRSDRGEPCAVLALDLNNFKGVNDTLGHAGGDAVLRSVADRLRRTLRDVDVVARPGGDEFVIIQAGHGQPESAERLATRLIAELGRPHEVNGHQVSTGVSIGIALVPQDGTDVGQVLRRADLALYEAKQGDRREYRFFEPGMQARVDERRQLEADLRRALDQGEFEVHYQPLVDLMGRQVVGLEALVRWRHPSRGLVPPGMFIPIAEETGLIDALGSWVLRTACVDAAQWPLPVRVAVNLSVRQFAQGDLDQVVANALEVSRLDPGRLELEVTETLLLQDTDEVVATLHRLRAGGVSISVDDFGTGYSSLSYLTRFPVDKVKVDRSFVELSHERVGAAIIGAVVGLCRSLGIVAVAEGIETDRQLRQVAALGCTEGQGYLFARPCPAADVAGLLRGWKS